MVDPDKNEVDSVRTTALPYHAANSGRKDPDDLSHSVKNTAGLGDRA